MQIITLKVTKRDLLQYVVRSNSVSKTCLFQLLRCVNNLGSSINHRSVFVNRVDGSQVLDERCWGATTPVHLHLSSDGSDHLSSPPFEGSGCFFKTHT